MLQGTCIFRRGPPQVPGALKSLLCDLPIVPDLPPTTPGRVFPTTFGLEGWVHKPVRFKSILRLGRVWTVFGNWSEVGLTVMDLDAQGFRWCCNCGSWMGVCLFDFGICPRGGVMLEGFGLFWEVHVYDDE